MNTKNKSLRNSVNPDGKEMSVTSGNIIHGLREFVFSFGRQKKKYFTTSS
jgi:hypothetical protein